MNNFQKLQKQQEEVYYSSEDGNKLKNEVKGTLTTFRFIGDVVDVYLPRVIDMFIAFSGGSIDDSGRKATGKRNDPASGNISHPTGKGPGEANDTIR